MFDGDNATITLARSDTDPLQTAVDAFRPAYITDAWIVRRLAGLVAATGSPAGASEAMASRRSRIPTTCSASPTEAPRRSVPRGRSDKSSSTP